MIINISGHYNGQLIIFKNVGRNTFMFLNIIINKQMENMTQQHFGP